MNTESERKLSSENKRAYHSLHGHHPHNTHKDENLSHHSHDTSSNPLIMPHEHHHCELHAHPAQKKPFPSGGETLITESLEEMTDNMLETISSAKDTVFEIAEKIIDKVESCIMPQHEDQPHHAPHSNTK